MRPSQQYQHLCEAIQANADAFVSECAARRDSIPHAAEIAWRLTQKFRVQVIVIPICTFVDSVGRPTYEKVLAYPAPPVVALL